MIHLASTIFMLACTLAISPIKKGNEDKSITEVCPIGSKVPNYCPGKDGLGPCLNETLGSVTLIYFWGSWSSPSVKALERVSGIYQRYSGKGLEVYSINKTDLNSKDAHQEKITWRFHVDDIRPDNYKKPWYVNQVFGEMFAPCYMLIDKSGIVHYVGTDQTASIEVEIEKLLAQ